MAGFILRVDFRGLCGFLPEKDFNQESRLVSVLLVNASRKEVFDNSTPLPIHYPLLWFPLEALPGISNHSSAGEGLIRLDSSDVVIVPRATDARSVRSIRTSKKDGQVPGKDDLEDLGWVPALEDVFPGKEGGIVNADCLSAQPREDRVTARIHLVQGSLKTAEVGKSEGVPILAHFVPEGQSGGVRQALASQVRLEMEVEGPVRIMARNFEDGTVQKIELQPPAGKEEQGLNIRIENFCATSVFREDCDHPNSRFGADLDFQWFARITKEHGGLKPGVETLHLPIPVAVRYQVKGGSGGCVPAECTSCVVRLPESGFGELAAVARSLVKAVEEGQDAK